MRLYTIGWTRETISIFVCMVLYFLSRIQAYVFQSPPGAVVSTDMEKQLFPVDRIVRIVENNNNTHAYDIESFIQCKKPSQLVRLSNTPEANASEDHLLVTGLESLNRSNLATVLHSHGKPFLDKYLPVPWNISDALIWWEGRHAFGTDRIDRGDACVADPGKSLALFKARRAGLGSNMLNRVNYFIWAGDVHAKKTLLYPRNIPGESYALRIVMERFFLFDLPETSCNGGQYFRGRLAGRIDSSDWDELSGYISYVQNLMPESIIGLKVLLLRQAMRLKPIMRNLLDRMHRKALMNLCLIDDDNSMLDIAIHIRRSDKWKEAKPAPAKEYVRAINKVIIESALDGKRHQHLVLHVISDADIRYEFEAMVESIYGKSFTTIQINFRISTEIRYRPDSSALTDKHLAIASLSFLRLLVDLRLIATARAFIGTQSSSMGIIGCMLRAHHKCYSVESPEFFWNPLRDKPRR